LCQLAIRVTLVKNCGGHFEMDKFMSQKEKKRAQVLGLREDGKNSQQ
jgi:hypothetical protein